MTRIISLLSLAVAFSLAVPQSAVAQPSRQLPGVRPYLPGSPLRPIPDPNSRVTAAPSNTGQQSTDFYGKKGYPRVLGDAVESSTGTTGGQTGGGIGGSANTGNTGVQSSGSGGFQGNAGTQIGQGSLFGGSFLGGGFNWQLGQGGNFAGIDPGARPTGVSGGAFTGMVPKGFGFGGAPDFTRSYTSPFHGAMGK